MKLTYTKAANNYFFLETWTLLGLSHHFGQTKPKCGWTLYHIELYFVYFMYIQCNS